MPHIYKIFGPPGTGKTTRMLSLLEREMEKVPPYQIAYVSFTRKGTYEGVDRATKKFNLQAEDLLYFRTIHSLCYKMLGLSRSDIMTQQQYYDFSSAMGMNFTGFYSDELKSNDDRYLFLCQLLLNNIDMYNLLIKDVNINKYHYVARNYMRYKEQFGVLDFTDMLYMYYQKGPQVPVKVAFVDEAQDLTSLQWLVIEKMFAGAERLYIAGDDDQAIYEWSGADVKKFLTCPADNFEVLHQSYRLPQKVHRFANKIIKNVSVRQEKDFLPRKEAGNVSVAQDVENIDINLSESTLFLARNTCTANFFARSLRQKGYNFLYKEKPALDPAAVTAIRAYNNAALAPPESDARRDFAMHKSFFAKNVDFSRPWDEFFFFESMKGCTTRRPCKTT